MILNDLLTALCDDENIKVVLQGTKSKTIYHGILKEWTNKADFIEQKIFLIYPLNNELYIHLWNC